MNPSKTSRDSVTDILLEEEPVALVVHDTEARALEEAGFNVLHVTGTDEGLQILNDKTPDLVIAGLAEASLEEDLGFLQAARREAMPLVVVTEARNADLAYEAGATDVWPDNASPAMLRQRLAFLVKATRAFRELCRKSQSLANHDAVTGLPNRHVFIDMVRRALEQSQRQSRPVAVLLLDIDRFKKVNESLGHRAGDKLLRDVAERLVQCLRKADVVARESDCKIARRGGDEFLFLLSDVSEAHHAASAARRLLDALRLPFRAEGKDVYLTASIGISMSQSADATEDLLRQAEIAMYSAKDSGRNAFQFFDEPMHAAVVERFEMETHLRRALAQDELELFYQPLVNAKTRAFVGVEALLRWNHPTMGRLSPDAFIPLAEETGLIISMGRWVLRTACQQLRSWRKQGVGALRISVNVSPREFSAPGFLESLKNILEETRMRPGELELELTERGVMQHDSKTLEVLRAVQKMGVRLAVDDFGTGHTTFHYLKHFPLDTIKIDKSFTQGVASDTKDAAITTALLVMAHRLKLNVVAEGVETEAQMSFLGDHRCDEVQGYLFGRPLPADKLFSALERYVCA
ncbi:MAG: EAL domain-containing protein [Acidobacteria bacterium]|nr:MAG: EAL domain-containing protein [Acidobacteriota bacterium]